MAAVTTDTEVGRIDLTVRARADAWARDMLALLAGARDPMPVRVAYGPVHGRGLSKKALQRALARAFTRTGECLVRRKVGSPGRRGSVVFLWTRDRWRWWRATTFAAARPRNPKRLREVVLRGVAERHGAVVSAAPWREPYTCPGCGQARYRAWSSRRRTCSARCRQRVSRHTRPGFSGLSSTTVTGAAQVHATVENGSAAAMFLPRRSPLFDGTSAPRLSRSRGRPSGLVGVPRCLELPTAGAQPGTAEWEGDTPQAGGPRP